MSGLTLAVAPRLDRNNGGSNNGEPSAGLMGGVMGSLNVVKLQLVAFILVFSASGLVPLFDMAFPVFISLYFLALSRWAFPSYKNALSSATPHEVFHGSRMFELYVIVGSTLGLFLPLAYVLGGFARGDQEAVKAATPHLFLLSFQILSENVISGLAMFSAPVRAMVPLLYTTRRLFSLMDWSYVAFRETEVEDKAGFKDVAWQRFGQGLAAANLVYFTINLFCFLIPRFLPRAFDRYFQERTEYKAKMAEDKRPSPPQSQPEPEPEPQPESQPQPRPESQPQSQSQPYVSHRKQKKSD